MKYIRRNKKWFLDRVGIKILAEHPAGSETEVTIESKTHAAILHNQRQSKDGYCFSDITKNVKEKN